MVTKIGIMSCCSTRDVFRTVFNYNYREDFKIAFEIQITTIISLMQNKINVNDELLEIPDIPPHNSKFIKEDLNKNFFNLMSNDIEYLIMDLYFDVYFGILKTEKGMITNNGHLPSTKFYKNLKEKQEIHILKNQQEFLNLFKENSKLFFKFMAKNYPNTKIILNSMRIINYEKMPDGNIESHYDSENHFNKSIKKLEDYLCENFDIIFNKFEVTKIDKNHIWGEGEVHFTPNYYQYTYRKFLKIIFNEELKNIQEKLINLEKSNEDLLQSNSWKLTKPLRFIKNYLK